MVQGSCLAKLSKKPPSIFLPSKLVVGKTATPAVSVYNLHLPFSIYRIKVYTDIFYLLTILFIFLYSPSLSLSSGPVLPCNSQPSQIFSPSVVVRWGFAQSPTASLMQTTYKMNARGICSTHSLGYDILRLAFSAFQISPLVWSGPLQKEQTYQGLQILKIKISYCPCGTAIFIIIFQDMHETTEHGLRQIGMK